MDLCPVDQIGRGGKLNHDDGLLDLMTTPKKDTPKRKFSPTAGTPLGKVRKMSTCVEASPKLRSQWIIHGGKDMPLHSDGAPDLMAGIGKLKIREIQTEQNINMDSEGSLEVTGLTPGEIKDQTRVSAAQKLNSSILSTPERQSAPMNVTQRLMIQAGRKRALSLGGKKIKSRNTSHARSRTISLGSQKRIDQIFDRTREGIHVTDELELDATTS